MAAKACRISGGVVDGGLTVVSKEMVGFGSDLSGLSRGLAFRVIWLFCLLCFSEEVGAFGCVVEVVRAAAKVALCPGAPGPGPEFGGCFCGVGAGLGSFDFIGMAGTILGFTVRPRWLRMETRLVLTACKRASDIKLWETAVCKLWDSHLSLIFSRTC